jgi:hypothetical protein
MSLSSTDPGRFAQAAGAVSPSAIVTDAHSRRA